MRASPASWSLVKLGDISEFKYGKALPATARDGGEFPVYGSNGIVGQHSRWLSVAPTIIIGRKGSVGEVCFSDKNCSPIDTTYYVDSFKCLEPKFCFYLLKTLRLGDLNKSTAIPGLNRQDAYNLEIGLPPLAEQTRIATKLDELLAQVDTLKARIDGMPALLKRFRQSVLAAAVSGRLTEEWRTMHTHRPALTIEDLEVLLRSSDFKSKAKGVAPAKSSIVPGWLDAPLGAVLTVRSGGGLTAKEMDDSGTIPVYGGNGVNGYHTEGNVKTRTVVIGRVGYYCGSVHFTPNEAWITDNALIVSFSSTVFDVNYIYWLLLGTNLRKNTSSSAQPVISGEKIYPINLSIPPLTEQTEIVRHVEQLFAFADQLETRIKAAQARINCLTQSILAKAFRGELVPQDPNDEPASVLLERIKAQRATAPNARRGLQAAQLS
ncbi:restriction endonuclease subunit S [Pseudomonas sp.]|uniref:restriction endonuclease subunit S n=1 Tax=Pseudomonas sp. TaxID=306 RepID=UPI0028A28E51|nr:restriction endonuclease subunit S [Pseudomonas sp.]